MKESAACGKCVLFGEHSILHGGAAVTLPVKKLQLKIHFTPGPENSLALGKEIFPNADELFWELLQKDFSDIPHSGNYIIESDIPLGAGLGSSAALSVALHRLHRPQIDQKELIERAMKSENLFHGKSSGMDPSTIATEKALYFKKPTDFTPLRDEMLRNPAYVFALFDSGIRRSTQSGISQSEILRKSNPEAWEKTLKGLMEVSERGKILFEKGQSQELGAAMNEAHQFLTAWGVSHPELEKIKSDLEKSQVLGAKITGAGRGGFLLCLFEKNNWKQFLNSEKSSKYKFLLL